MGEPGKKAPMGSDGLRVRRDRFSTSPVATGPGRELDGGEAMGCELECVVTRGDGFGRPPADSRRPLYGTRVIRQSEGALYFLGSAIQEVNYRNSISTMSPSFSW
jgi:hypothetical protein